MSESVAAAAATDGGGRNPGRATRTQLSSDDVICAERNHIRQGSCDPKDINASGPVWTGIALSGGGIRSATFCLGALQALAGQKLLAKFEFMSSVSGGSYIASSLQWWWSQRDEKTAKHRFDAGARDFPFGTADPGEPIESDEPGPLKFLRDNANYLTPGKGINVWSGFAVVLRTAVLSFAVWLPLLVFVFLLVHSVNASDAARPVRSALSAALPLATDPAVCDLRCLLQPGFAYTLAFALVALLAALFFLSSVAFGFLSRIPPDRIIHFKGVGLLVSLVGLAATLSLAFAFTRVFERLAPDTAILITALLVVSLTMVLRYLLVLSASIDQQNANYVFRRWQERAFGLAFVPALLVLAAALLPFPPLLLFDWLFPKGLPQDGLFAGALASVVAGGAAGGISFVSGIASAIYGFTTLVRAGRPGRLGRILAPLGAGVLVYGVLTSAYLLAIVVYAAGQNNTAHALPAGWSAAWIVVGFYAALTMAVALCLFANVNQIGLHRYYRDRLMEAFMPGIDAFKRGRAWRSAAADLFSIADAAHDRRDCPYPIINTNAILVNDADATVAGRGGDSFVLSPLHVGSTATGWLRTDDYIAHNGPLTLASAMAVSGAAVNGNAGYAGTGVTRNRIVALAMTFLNARLGLWLRNPSRPARFPQMAVPTYLRPTLNTLFFGGHRRTSAFVELSDGGHFDNLGLYELIRRRLDLILVVDGEGDAAVSLPAFVSVIRRVRADFGATIRVEATGGPERLVPVAPESAAYPSAARFAKSAFFVCSVEYKGGQRGVVIYLKASLLPSSYFATRGYRALNPDFPNQSTADQFFDPVQFESYRELGFGCAREMIKDLKLTEMLEQRDDLVSKLVASAHRSGDP